MEPLPEDEGPGALDSNDQAAAACLKVDRVTALTWITSPFVLKCSEAMHFVDDLTGESQVFSVLFCAHFQDLPFPRLRQHEAQVDPHPEVEGSLGESGDQAAAACLKVDRVPDLTWITSPCDHVFSNILKPCIL